MDNQDLLGKDLKDRLNFQSEPEPNPQSNIIENKFNNILDNQPKKEEPLGTINIPESGKGTKIQRSLDSFIQECLNKYKPVDDPDPSMYTNTTTEEEKNLIISRKSTIPDLVIWNKNFNKNECYVDADIEKQSDFPRFRFYLRLGNKDKGGKNKNEKNKNKDKKNKKNKKDKKNNLNNEQDSNEVINNLMKDMNNLNINNEKKDINNDNKRKKEKKKKNKII